MTRRQWLAGLVFCLAGAALAGAAPGGPDPRLNDLRLEEQISQAQARCVKAGEAYQKWFNGRMHSKPAEAEVVKDLADLQAFQNEAAKLAVPRAQAAVRHWARVQKQELNFFLTDIRHNNIRPSQADLQQRWQNAVSIQEDLLKARREQLQVARVGSSGLIGGYYQWKETILNVQDAELALARQVALAFSQHSSLQGVAVKALRVTTLASGLKASSACQKAQALYIQRFEALTSLCRAAEDAIEQPDQDSVAILQENEEIYRQKTLASDDASLAALRTLILKTR